MVNGGDGHRDVEGLVLERQALRGGGHARRRAGRPLPSHDRRWLHRGDVAISRLIGAGAGPDVQHRLRVPERVPDLRGDPRISTPCRGVSVADRVVQPWAEHLQLLLRRHLQSLRPCLKFPVDGRHHGVSAITPLQQQAAQSAQVRDRVGGRVVDQFCNLPQPEAQPPVCQHLAQSLNVARRIGPVPGRGPRRRPNELDLVVVMQRADAHAGQLGHASHGPVIVHGTDYAA